MSNFNEKITNSIILDTQALFARRQMTGLGGRTLLFILFDAGETKALQPVMHELDLSHTPYKIMSFATSWTLIHQHPQALDMRSIHTALGMKIPSEWDRHQGLTPKILKKLLASQQPDLVITGMVSEIQHQLVVGLSEKGADILAFYDSFAPLENFPLAKSFLDHVSMILVPSESVAESLLENAPFANVEVVGHPTLEHWIAQSQAIPLSTTRENLELNDSKPLLVYISGYGKGYEEAFKQFVEAIQYVDHFHIGISLHPRMDGTLEKKVLDACGCSHVKIFPKKVPTEQIVALADVVVTRHSTVGVQASFLGKPVIYLDLKGSSYQSLSIEKGWALHLTDSAELLRLLVDFELENINVEDRFAEGGVPQKSARRIAKRIVPSKERSFVPRKPLDPSIINLFQSRFP